MPGLGRYLAKRGSDRVILVVTVVTLQFVLLRVVPTYVMGIDPSRFLIDLDAPPDQKILLRKQFGLDEPIFPHQYIRYVLNLFRGEFGFSFLTRQPVVNEIMERLPNTVILSGSSILLDFIIGLSIGLYTATRRGKRVDSAIIQSSIFSYIMPIWLMGLVLLTFLAWFPAVTWGIKLFPVSGTTSPFLPPDPFVRVLDYLWHLALPLMASVITGFGGRTYYFRNLAITEMEQDYVLTARAKGLSEKRIMRCHVLKGVAPPVVTSVALSVPGVVSGWIITETVFSWYGLGLYVFQAISSYNYPAVQAVLFMQAVITAISLFIADIAISYIDPRVRLR